VFNKILNFQVKNITFGALILAIFYFLSAVLGLFRDRLLASHFGAGLESDVYFAAFRIPDFVYNILILGGLIVAFLPLFSEYFARNKEKAWEMTNYILNAFLVFLVSISFILFIFTPWLIKWIFPGFGPEHLKLAIPLIRLLLLSPIIFGLSNIFSGILQYFGRFFVYGLAPILYNLGIILGIIFLAPRFGVFGVGIGVILGALFYFLIQFPSARNCGFFYKFLLNFKYPAVKRIFQLMVPRVFGIATQQINLIVMMAVASLIGSGSIAIFNFSNNLQSLPVGVIGTSFALAVFPVLSRTWVSNQKKEFSENFISAFSQILFLIIPISVLFFILKTQIVRIIYQTGRFGMEEAQITAACLGIFAFSIFAQSLIPLLVRAFFSFQDTKTPTIITVSAIFLNIVLAFSFVWLMNFPNLFSNFVENIFKVGKIENAVIIVLPLAFSIATIFQFILLLIFLRKKIENLRLFEIWYSLKKILLSTLLMVIFVYFTIYLLVNFLNIKTLIGVFIQTIFAILIGLLIYILVTILLGSPELKTIKSSILKQFNR
jgi:putative peptidoglycan lipid II flippase